MLIFFCFNKLCMKINIRPNTFCDGVVASEYKLITIGPVLRAVCMESAAVSCRAYRLSHISTWTCQVNSPKQKPLWLLYFSLCKSFAHLAYRVSLYIFCCVFYFILFLLSHLLGNFRVRFRLMCVFCSVCVSEVIVQRLEKRNNK